MKIIYQQTPMSVKKIIKECSRCDVKISTGELYCLHKKDIICNACIAPDEYVSLAKLFRGTKKRFSHHGFTWDVEKIEKDIASGIYPKMVHSTNELIGFNSGIIIVREWMNQAELDAPGILVIKNHAVFDILDGHHRLQKRFETGCSKMEFFELSLRESFKYLIGTEQELVMFLERYVDKGK